MQDESKRLAPKVPPVAAAAAAARGPRRKKLKWRTRDQQSSQLYNLQLDLHDLRQEIKTLQDYEQVLRTHNQNQREQLDDYYMKRIMQYHKVFEHGYDPTVDATGLLSSADAAQFLNQLMEDEVAVGRFVGRDMVLDQWTRYTRAFSGLQVRLTQSRVASADEVVIVSATATYAFEITQTTLKTLFPKMLAVQPQIGDKLLGRQFEGVGVSTFTFDTQSHRVVCYDSQMDFFNVFAHLLQDSAELCVLFDGASVTEESFIGDTSTYTVGNSEEQHPYRLFMEAGDGDDEDESQSSSSPDSYKLQLQHILDS